MHSVPALAMTAAVLAAFGILALFVGAFFGLRLLYLRLRQPVSLSFLAVFSLTALLCAAYFVVTVPVPSPWQLSAKEIAWFRFAIGLGVMASLLTVIDSLLFMGYLVERRQFYLPGPLRLAIHAAIAGLIGLVLLRTVLHINVVALVAVPTVLTAVVGLALKDTLTRLFEGITLGRHMHIGDWVSLVGKEGRVVSITLGYVTLQTRENDHVMIPNNIIAQKDIVNFSKPSREHLCSVLIEASFRDPPTRVIEVCQRTARAVPGVFRVDQTYAQACRDSGIEYRVRFYVADYADRPRIESEVLTYLWNAFQREGIEIPYPVRVLQNAPTASVPLEPRVADIHAVLVRIDFLTGLSRIEVERIANSAERHVYLPGEQVIVEGETDTRFFCIEQGVATVRVGAEGHARDVAKLDEGKYFGEMSLLTGEPRAATVVAASELHVIVIDKPIMQELLAANPEMAERLAQPLAARQSALAHARAEAEGDAAVTDNPEPKHGRLADRIRHFLGRA